MSSSVDLEIATAPARARPSPPYATSLCQHDLWQEPPEVGLERLDPLNCDRGDLGALGAVEGGRFVAKAMYDKLEPKLGQYVDRAATSCDLEAPGQQSARGGNGDDEHQVA